MPVKTAGLEAVMGCAGIVDGGVQSHPTPAVDCWSSGGLRHLECHFCIEPASQLKVVRKHSSSVTEVLFSW